MKENHPDEIIARFRNIRSVKEAIVILTADRATLAKRRWRGVAQDGREFGFDLDHVLVRWKRFS